MPRYTTSFAALAAFAALAGAQSAQAEHHDQSTHDQTITNVRIAELERVVAALGHTVESRGPVEGDPEYPEALVATDTEGLRYYLIGTACDIPPVPGCRGVMMQVRYPRPAGVTETTLMRTSRRQAALNLWFNEAGEILGMTRYVVLDEGVTLANVVENLKVLLTLAPIALDQAKQEVDEEGERD